MLFVSVIIVLFCFTLLCNFVKHGMFTVLIFTACFLFIWVKFALLCFTNLRPSYFSYKTFIFKLFSVYFALLTNAIVFQLLKTLYFKLFSIFSLFSFTNYLTQHFFQLLNLLLLCVWLLTCVTLNNIKYFLKILKFSINIISLIVQNTEHHLSDHWCTCLSFDVLGGKTAYIF